MIFRCGITWAEEKKRRGEWHDFFPLFPRTVAVNDRGEKSCAWLQTIQRKSEFHCYGMDAYWSNEYRLKPHDDIQESS